MAGKSTSGFSLAASPANAEKLSWDEKTRAILPVEAAEGASRASRPVARHFGLGRRYTCADGGGDGIGNSSGTASGRVMALDVGKVRVGVALSDPLGYTAQPLLTLWRKSRGEDLRSLLRLIRKHEVASIVVGNPLHLSGDVSPWAAKVQAFAAELRARSGLPVELWDERLSSVAAHEILDEAGHDRRNRKQVIDQVAAVVILRGWMEAKQEAASRANMPSSSLSAE